MQDNQSVIHHHLRTISRINTLIALLSVAAVAGLYVWLRWFPPTPVAAPAAVVTETSVTVAEYQTQLNAILSEFELSDSAAAQQKASDVLELRVPAEMKQLHMQVVLALSDAQAGNIDAARERMSALKKQYAWLAIQP